MSLPASSTTEQSQHETLIPVSVYPESPRKDWRRRRRSWRRSWRGKRKEGGGRRKEGKGRAAAG
eukprot:7246599-Pyramimonas_sp.AAC.1